MFNRSTKLTALLVAAASVASMTPVMAAEKLNQKDGTVKNAVAYDGGKYAYYGYKDEDNDDTGVWYNSGSGSDKLIDDLEEYEIKEKYGNKYAYVTEDGNKDEYLVDLSTGKVADEETAEDKQESAQAKLISNLKKAERYNTTSDTSYTLDESKVETNRIFKNQFGDVWYQYVVTATSAATAQDLLADTDDDVKVKSNASTTASGVTFGGDTDSADAFVGFVNEKGKYIDASYLANLKIYNPRKDKATVIEKFGKVYKDEALKADLVGLKPLAQDKDYIYAVATVDVTYYPLKSGSTTEYDFNATVTPVKQYFLQKISKTQGDKEDGAYIPKSVESYQIDKKDGIYDNDGDRNKVYDILVSSTDAGSHELSGSDMPDNDAEVLYSVKGDYIYAAFIRDNGGKVQAYKIKLSKKKLDVKGADGNSIKNINSAKGADIDTKILVVDADDNHDIADGQTYEGASEIDAVSVDVEGNIWGINKGKIFMFDDGSFKDKYSTDRSYNRLDVYDKDSLIAWDDDDDSYTTVQEGKKQTVDDAQVIDPSLTNKTDDNTTVKTGWVQETDGTWSLYDATGAKTVGWANVSGTWYYMNAAGAMQTGWVQDAGKWYYLNPVSDGTKGAMKTGWIYDNGAWYYLESSGAMAASKWIQDNGTWYYLKASGAMAASEYVDGYYVNASGAWV